MSNLKLPPYQKTPQQRRSYAGFPSTTQSSNFANSFQLLVTPPPSTNSSTSKMATDSKIPAEYETMASQVAGHTVQVGSDEVGMLRCTDEGSVLKPGGAPLCAAREIKFYEQLLTSTDPALSPLREFTTEYRGTKTLNVGTKTINFIKLQDLTHGMLEPCVMDIKMGERTWDPLASDKKKESEASKYKQCKESVGFCIPGFQTYHIQSGTLKKFGRDYGKKLNKDTVRDALRIFLNADSGLSRQLITAILTNLWAIQKWMRTQTVFQFFSSSILIVYDARSLRQTLETQKRRSASPNPLEYLNGTTIPTGPGSNGDLKASPGSNRNSGSFGSNRNSGNYGGTGSNRNSGSFISNRNSGSFSPVGDGVDSNKPATPTAVYKMIQRSHSATNDYEKDMKNIKDDYQIMLDNLIGAFSDKKPWVQVKMIDFAHTFNNNELSEDQAPGLDSNYLNAIDHLVEIFEEFLKTCD